MNNTKVQLNLSDLFNVDPIPENPKFGIEKPCCTTSSTNQQNGQLATIDQDQWQQEDDQIKCEINDDYQKAKSSLENLLANSESLLELAIQVAQGTESPKSIESVTKLIGQIADINTKIIDLTAKKQDVIIKTRPKTSTKFSLNEDSLPINNVTNNTMFVGSVTDLLKQLKQVQSDNDVIDIKESK